MGATLADIPSELLVHTFSFLTPREVLIAAAHVCKLWGKLSQDQMLWKQFCKIEGWDSYSAVDQPSNWKKIYQSSINLYPNSLCSFVKLKFRF